jgi:hypothetical protein
VDDFKESRMKLVERTKLNRKSATHGPLVRKITR